MRQRRRNSSPFRSPVVIGSLTVLVLVVSVVIAFGANTSLPFVPHYILHVQVRDAEEIVHGGEVHMGGALIGNVTSVTASRDAAGQPIAVLDLALDKSAEPLPANSRFTVRLSGAIGTKFLDVSRGNSNRMLANGATVPVAQTGATTDLDQVLDMFNAPTRVGVQRSTVGFGTALAGRGTAINNTLGVLPALIDNLGPVMSNLASRKTDLSGFISGLGAFTHALAPVAGAQAQLFTGLDTTFTALAGVAEPYLQDTISDTAPAFEQVTADAPGIDHFLNDTTTLLAAFRPGFEALPASAPVLADAFATGAKALPGTGAFDQRVVSLSATLHRYSSNATVEAGLQRLTQTASALKAPLSFLTPVQSTCNYVTLALSNLSSTLSDHVGSGTVLRFVLLAIDDVPGGEAVPSSKPFLTTGTAGGTEHGPLHVDPYPYTASPGQPQACSAGNEPYSAAKAQIGPPAGAGIVHKKSAG
jgi:ABC-type transporter Mla subunit MlaD